MSFIPKFLVGALAVLVAGLTPITSHAAVDGSHVTTSGEDFTIELNEGKLIRLAREADSVFIANPAIADVSVKSTRLIYIFGKAPGETSLFAVDANENVIANMKIVVTHNITRLQASLDKLIPGGEVTAVSIEGGIILMGSVETGIQSEDARRLAAHFIGKTEEVINRLGVTSPNQINLRVRIAEVSRDVVNEFGLDWSALYDGSFSVGLTSLNPFFAGTNTLAGSGNIGNLDLNVLIDALATDNLVTLLAEPNLTALSGETASFLAGGEFPIPVAQDDDSVTIEFKEFGVSLSFTPTLIGNGKISMRVRPEVSSLSNDAQLRLANFVIPSLITRRAETTVELASGQSFAIAGLIQDKTRQAASKLPGLGDIPILGALFQSDRFERNETELVIIVTPYIVKPVNPDQIADPVTPFNEPQGEGDPPGPTTTTMRTIPLKSGNGTTGNNSRPAGFIVE
ncbi:MAG: type II and III secretion system protein family protein [Proteobacteria bacterium]|nr:type II and III secretion system protein family protein [Pseudomonadota bacterium]